MTLRLGTSLLLLALFLNFSTAALDIFGLRKSIYNPRCAHACRETVSSASSLECTSKFARTTSLECFATDDNYLQTLGYCISSHCQDGLDVLEKFWASYVVGWKVTSPVPKYNYETAIRLADKPTETAAIGKQIDKVYAIGDSDYAKSFTSLADWNDAEDLHTRFALALFVAGFVVPVILSLLRFVPVSSALASRYRAIFIYPTVWSHRWSMQIREAGDISPTRGQALFIFYLLLLNVLFFISCLANRFGALSLAYIPLIFLYAGRNNLLLISTSWSHTTFIMIHRWLGYFVIAEAIFHSILYLYVAVQQHAHTSWSHVPAWYSGSIGTIAIALIAPLSIVYIRKRTYEVFLFIHIAVTIIALVGTYFHITYLFNTQVSGWALYLWISIIFWSYDRVARIVRLLFNGVSRAMITIIDEEYIRVDIPHARGKGHAYLYFPTLTWRFWENHPFSIATSPGKLNDSGSYFNGGLRFRLEREELHIGLDPRIYSPGSMSDKSSPGYDVRSTYSKDDPGSPLTMKSPISPLTPLTPMSAFPLFSPPLSDSSLLSPKSTRNLLPSPDKKAPQGKSNGLTFFMRTHSGTTAHLRKRISLPVLAESSYGPPKDLSTYPVLICVAGGVGITSILPFLHAHQGTTRLYWGSRSQGLVNALRDEIRGYNGEISVGRRLFVKLVLQREFSRVDGGTPVAVVVSGPKGMCEEVREFCCEIAGKRRGEVRFLDENFSW